MIDDTRIDLAGDRWVAFIRTLPIVNANLTDAAFSMQVRAVPDVAGTPLVDLSTVATAAEEGVRLVSVTLSTIAAHIAYGRLPGVPLAINPATGVRYVVGDTVTVSLLGIRINETTMEGLPFPGSGDAAERGDNVVLAWDMHITPIGGTKDKYAGGKFTVRAGTTQ